MQQPPATAEDVHAHRGSPKHNMFDASATPRPRKSRSPKSRESTPKAHQTVLKEEADSPAESIETGSESGAEDPDRTLIDNKADLAEELEREKQRYTGASTWAKDEEHLFEILYLRAERPLMPPHWDVDFRGVPMVDSVFHGDGPVAPIIYSHSRKEFNATMALMRLIDLTADVRTTCQSGLKRKAPAMIKRAIDRFIQWAGEDGDYLTLKTVPNIITAIVDAERKEEDITAFMEARMRALAAAQRDFLQFDQDTDFWNLDAQREASPDIELVELLVQKYLEKERRDRRLEREKNDQGAGEVSVDEFQPPEMGYRHEPPVIYGLFVLDTSVFLLTVDSAKGPDAYVSFHVDMDFKDQHQSVWNALTAAIPVCLARDTLIQRREEFDALSVVSESDPDA